MNHGGRVALLGIPPPDMAIDWNQVIFKGLVIKGIYGREMFETWYKMAAMLQSGLDMSPIITHRFVCRAVRGGVRGDAVRARAARSSSTGLPSAGSRGFAELRHTRHVHLPTADSTMSDPAARTGERTQPSSKPPEQPGP